MFKIITLYNNYCNSMKKTKTFIKFKINRNIYYHTFNFCFNDFNFHKKMYSKFFSKL